MRSTGLLLVGLVGCSTFETAGAPGGAQLADAATEMPDARVMDAIDRRMVREAERLAAFSRVNRAPYSSTIGAFSIDVFVNQDLRDYRRIHPETTGSGVVVPVGTMIVREVLDAQNQVTKVTLMAKQAAGYDPTLGDWWFGVTDPSGTPLDDGAGPQVGRLTECHGCHLPRAQDDFLFGVPQGAQRPGGP
jgi:Cytochrome P460